MSAAEHSPSFIPEPTDGDGAPVNTAGSVTIAIDGIGLWAPGLPGWAVARERLVGDRGLQDPPAGRPVPDMLAPNERRRAPDAVVLALEVARQAMASQPASMATTPSVFVSAHGDLATVDALCATLADDPLLLSPTRFHHSVHNAASGYWAIAAGAMAPTTALSAHLDSFAAGLLEAAAQCVADGQPVLLVGADTEARGPLAALHDSRGLLGLALLLAPAAGPHTLATLRLAPRAGHAPPAPLRSTAGRSLQANAMARALPLFEALAAGAATPLALPLGPALHLALALAPAGRPREVAAS